MIIKLLSDGGYSTVSKCVGKQLFAKKSVTGSGVLVSMVRLNAEGATLSGDDIKFCKGELFFSNKFQLEYKVIKA